MTRRRHPATLLWRACDVLTRRRCMTDQVTENPEYTPGGLEDHANTMRRLIREGTGTGPTVGRVVRAQLDHARLCDDLAQRLYIARRLDAERAAHARLYESMRVDYPHAFPEPEWEKP